MLKKIIINNFSSFDNSVFEFEKLNCLVAPNNTGKSNLIKVFEFLDLALYHGIEFAILTFGGYDKIKNYRSKSSKVEIEATFEIENQSLVNYDFTDYKMTIIINIQIDLRTQQSNIDLFIEGSLKGININEIERENLLIDRVVGDEIKSSISNYEQSLEKLSNKRYSNFIFAYSLNTRGYTLHNLNQEKTRFLFNLFGMQLNSKKELVSPLSFANIFNNTNIFSSYYFIPNTMKMTQNFHSKFLERKGTNLAYYLSTLDNETFEKISMSLIGEVEVISGITIEEEESKKLYFIEEINSDEKKLIPITDVSDGTLHFISIMTALLGNSQSIGLMIEEPERHMHMKTLSYILNTMRDDNKQIFFTTHSTEILQQLNLDEIMFMFRDFDGNTKGQRAKDIPHIKDYMKRYKNDLVELIKLSIVGEYEDE